VQIVHRRELLLESREEDRITEGFYKSSARRALSRCQRAQERTPMSSRTKKTPGKDFHRVVEYPVGSTRSCLSKWLPRGHQFSI
jgi:hypothetical protein